MRKTPALDALFTTPRKGILAATLMQPDRWWYLSDLARHLRLHHASLQRELARLTAAEILASRRDGNRVYYRANPGSPVFPELRGLMLKTAGLVDVLTGLLVPFSGRIQVAFVYGSIARADETAASDIDLMIIGHVGLQELVPALQEAEKAVGRPINPNPYAPEEFAARAASSSFLRRVLSGAKLFVFGGQDVLEGLVEGGTRPNARARSEGPPRSATRRRTLPGRRPRRRALS